MGPSRSRALLLDPNGPLLWHQHHLEEPCDAVAVVIQLLDHETHLMNFKVGKLCSRIVSKSLRSSEVWTISSASNNELGHSTSLAQITRF